MSSEWGVWSSEKFVGTFIPASGILMMGELKKQRAKIALMKKLFSIR
jgi:hypothetical protein